jgi:gamma-glutamylputrescine oxidase
MELLATKVSGLGGQSRVPFWMEEAPAFQPPKRRLVSRSEIVVIGGGIMGMSVAYWLARKGLSVALIESKEVASGSSSRNAGVFLAGRTPIEEPMLTCDVLQREGIDARLEQVGHMSLTLCADVWERIQSEATRCNDDSIKALGRHDCQDLLGLKLSERFLGGRWFARGRLIHPVRFVYGLAEAACRHGARIFTQTSAHSVVDSGSGVQIRTNRGVLRAKHVVFACNAAIASLLPAMCRVIRPYRGQVLSSAPVRPTFRPGMALDWGTVYWRQTAGGEIVMGGYRNLDPTAEVGHHDQINNRIQSTLEDFLPTYFPGFPKLQVLRRWSGIMDSTPDEKPLIGRLPGNASQWIIGGFAGHGLPAAIGAGKALSTAIAEGRASDLLQRYDPARFFPELSTCQP